MSHTDQALAGLREQVIELGPWYLDVEITPELSSRAWFETSRGNIPESKDFGDTGFRTGRREPFLEKLRRIYPDGLQGRTVLDCACNCGAYLFWAKEAGAGECFGFDVREHWIKQARFLLEHREGPKDGMRFETLELYDLPKLDLEPFDITVFSGIFYHLPDPIAGLKIAADLTKELIIVNTATRDGLPDGLLAQGDDRGRKVFVGIHGMNWRPTGPGVLDGLLRWMGFVETHVVRRRSQVKPDWGRLEMVGSKKPGLLPTLGPSPVCR